MSGYLKHKEDMQQIIINVKDLCARIVSKMWRIIICACVFSVVLCAVKYCLDVKEYENSIDKNNVEQVESTVDQKGQLLVEYEKSISDHIKYLKESILMKINASSVNVVSLQYYIDCSEEDLVTIIAIYKDYVERGGLVQDLAKDGSAISSNYLQEIIHFNVSDVSSEYVDRIFSIDICGLSAEESDLLADQVAAKMPLAALSVFEENESNCTLIRKSTHVRSVDWIKQQQITQRSYLEMVQSQYTTLKTNAELEGYVLGQESSQDIEIVAPTIDIIYLFIGAMLGVMFALVTICVEYFMTQTVKYSEEIYYKTGLNYLGEQSVAKRSKWELLSDRVFYSERLNDSKDRIALLVTKIVTLCKNNHIDSIQMVGDYSKETKSFLQKCFEDIERYDIKVQILGDVLSDIDTINGITNHSNVILVQTLEQTKYKTVAHQITFCEDAQANIIGYISLR